MMAWGPLLAGCLAGISLAVALLVLAGPVEPPAALSAGVRLSFLPVVAGLAFALPDPHRLLTGSLPARPWLLPVLRTALALPVVSAGSAVQLVVAGRAMAIDLRAAGQSPAPWQWQALTAELVAWSALALALTVILDRGRWAGSGRPLRGSRLLGSGRASRGAASAPDPGGGRVVHGGSAAPVGTRLAELAGGRRGRGSARVAGGRRSLAAAEDPGANRLPGCGAGSQAVGPALP